MAAQYLVRFDDICPGMNWGVWRQVESALERNGVRPLLGVVPDNQDPELDLAPPEPQFWDCVREWQARGYAIGLHGYQHKYVTRASGLVGRNRYSEFAGLAFEEQLEKLERGMAIFAREGVRADAWIAPAHSFDKATVAALRQVGIRWISDGYALQPYLSDGMMWAPQQLGGFREFPFGFWTVCLHVNNWSAADVAAFERDLERFQERIVSLEAIQARFGTRTAGVGDRVFDRGFRAIRAVRAMLRGPEAPCRSLS